MKRLYIILSVLLCAISTNAQIRSTLSIKSLTNYSDTSLKNKIPPAPIPPSRVNNYVQGWIQDSLYERIRQDSISYWVTFTKWTDTTSVLATQAYVNNHSGANYSATKPIVITGQVISADTGRAVAQLPTGGDLNKVRDSITYAESQTYVPYTGAITTVDLGSQQLNAQSFKINGTGGAGHIDFKWQSAIPPSIGNSSATYADANGNFSWLRNGAYTTTLATNNNTANRTYTFQDKSYTIADSASIPTAGYGLTGNLRVDTTVINKKFAVTAPITLSSNTVSITQATTSTNGYLSSTDWNTFNNKVSATNLYTSLTDTGNARTFGTISTYGNSTYGVRGLNLGYTGINYTIAAQSDLSLLFSSGQGNFMQFVNANNRPISFLSSSAANSAAINFTGSIYSGGSGTTTLPYMYFNQGATAPTSWSTAGTLLGMNAPSGFTGNFLDLYINGGSPGGGAGTHYFNISATSNQTTLNSDNGILNITSGHKISITSSQYDWTRLSGGMVCIGSNAGNSGYLGDGYLLVNSGLAIGNGVNTMVGSSLLGIGKAPTASANYGLVSLGDAPFDGSTAGKFVGSSNGTVLGVNISGSADIMNAQVSGVSKFKVDNGGNSLAAGYVASSTGTFYSALSNGIRCITSNNAYGIDFNTAITSYNVALIRNYAVLLGFNSLGSAFLPTAVQASANYGLLSLGNGAFDGSTAGFFAGSSNGTVLGVNITGSADFLNFQLSGVSRFKIANDGTVTIGNSSPIVATYHQGTGATQFRDGANDASILMNGGVVNVNSGVLKATNGLTFDGTNTLTTMSGYTAGSTTPTGYITITVNGTAYKVAVQ